ncbi:MAG: diaminopimelate decarboxylase [Cyanobacteria bacterium]|nr:diaminopimelate decarboxylase [Cyanobacteria bacterium CG_2015-16_32_12]NCO77381.1 diaminopimelate decarboxylase [Cyanobacteria bacterium CG_2015-22_32_23]NCQ03978.1 diaminopimelate decarboxylase [Cyanobacteria bacterium CG_2015-09_32_10]NCQ42526.1 diaminopimelate decarboxylase [Cyanobacteria bacterium CG_2015-04_32_10]NCS83914.1 diaminopimelate decarboxylase [Cyanobacteria bacterium CG_2015-02_32_10]
MLLTEKSTSEKFIVTSDSHTSPNQQLLPLTATINEKNHLVIGGCDVTELVTQFGSPLYILDEKTLRTCAAQYRDGFKEFYTGESQVIYASKAWSSMAIASILASEGIGFDVVSGGELYTTRKALEISGFTTEEINQKIYLHGNNKSVSELELAIDCECKIIVDNWLELETLAKLTAEKQKSVDILIRLTPGIECHTHDYIRTGSIDSKFGFDANQLEAVFTFVKEQQFMNCIGLHAHIGSQIFELQPHHDLGEVLTGWFKTALDYGLPVKELNIGGGLGIRYTESDDPPSITDWVKTVAQSVTEAFTKRNLALPKLIAEPGRSMIASACVTAYTVGSRKVIPNIRTYVSVDGGMSDNPRPITYQSLYQVVIANKMRSENAETVTIAGKHCESGDILIKNIDLPDTQPGDILVVSATGAYNYSMASNYNRIGKPAAVLVNEGEANLILRRETYEDLVKQDLLPHRLTK